MGWQSFAGIRGHGTQIEVLRRICGSARPAHAYLFEGPAGIGKQAVAWALGARLACLDSVGPGDACGSCRSCHALQRGEHPDIVLLARDGASIKIGQVRDTLKRLRFEPVIGRVKVLIIEDADRLRIEAANALLKTLEEPSPRTHFILVTSAPQLLLPTIRSRAQVQHFSPLSPTDVRQQLLAEGFDEDAASAACALSRGELSRARKLCDPPLLAVVDEIVRHALKMDLTSPSHAVDFVADLTDRLAAIDGLKGARVRLESERLLWTLDVFRALLRDVMVAAAGIPVDTLPHARYADAIEEMAARVRSRDVADVLGSIVQLEARLAYNPNTRMALEAELVSAHSRLAG